MPRPKWFWLLLPKQKYLVVRGRNPVTSSWLRDSCNPPSCIKVSQPFFSYVPTPSGWPQGGPRFSVSGPCLSRASWAALPLYSMIPWPCGMAEPCNRHRKKGGQCPSAASLPAAGVGALRRAPEGPCHGQHGFGHFCRNKSGSSYGAETPSPIPRSILPPLITLA